MRRHRKFSFKAETPTNLRAVMGKGFSQQRITALNRKIADFLVRKFATYIHDRSLTRHKSADRLGARPTGVLEFTPSANPSYNKRGGKIFGEVKSKTAVVTIQGVAGLARAFHDVFIYPRRAKALTIPCDAEAYANTARKMEDLGWRLFIPRRKRRNMEKGVLMGKKGGLTKPLFLLRRSAHIKRDARLLPSQQNVAQWTAMAVREYMEAANL